MADQLIMIATEKHSVINRTKDELHEILRKKNPSLSLAQRDDENMQSTRRSVIKDHTIFKPQQTKGSRPYNQSHSYFEPRNLIDLCQYEDMSPALEKKSNMVLEKYKKPASAGLSKVQSQRIMQNDTRMSHQTQVKNPSGQKAIQGTVK